MTENGKENIWDTFKKLIEECPYDTTPAKMEGCVHNEDDDKKEIVAENKDEVVIHRDITENENETNQDTLDKEIE